MQANRREHFPEYSSRDCQLQSFIDVPDVVQPTNSKETTNPSTTTEASGAVSKERDRILKEIRGLFDQLRKVDGQERDPSIDVFEELFRKIIEQK